MKQIKNPVRISRLSKNRLLVPLFIVHGPFSMALLPSPYSKLEGNMSDSLSLRVNTTWLTGKSVLAGQQKRFF